MKILFYGDSITDMGRGKQPENSQSSCIYSYGSGYPMFVAGRLYGENPQKYEVVNRGISGNRVVDLYARIKVDVWNHEPDVLSILIGINDIWHEIGSQNGVELDRFETFYRMLLEDTKKKLPNVKLIICEPFVLEGSATAEKMELFSQVKDYAAVAKKLSEEFDAVFVPLQEKYDELGAKYGNDALLGDGVHPTLAGAVVLANEWLKGYDKLMSK